MKSMCAKRLLALTMPLIVCIALSADPVRYAEEGKYETIVLDLNEDGSFSIGPTGETGGEHQSGHYTSTATSITLTVEISDQADFSVLHAKRVEYKKVEISDSIFSTQRIVAPNERPLVLLGSRPKPDSKRVLNGYKVIVTDSVLMAPFDNVKVRTGPSRSFPAAEDIYIDGITDKPISYLPKGYGVTVLAKTVDEEIIDGIKGAWYYCSVIAGWYDSGPRLGWIFGGYLAPK